MTGRLLVAASLSAVALAGAGCANTINDAALTPDSTTATTLYAPAGTTDELLDQLVAEAGGLSEAIVQNQGDEELMRRLDAIWAAARPGVETRGVVLVREFDQAIELLHLGVERRRPADADKATRNLQTLIATM